MGREGQFCLFVIDGLLKASVGKQTVYGDGAMLFTWAESSPGPWSPPWFIYLFSALMSCSHTGAYTSLCNSSGRRLSWTTSLKACFHYSLLAYWHTNISHRLKLFSFVRSQLFPRTCPRSSSYKPSQWCRGLNESGLFTLNPLHTSLDFILSYLHANVIAAFKFYIKQLDMFACFLLSFTLYIICTIHTNQA